MDDKGWVKIHRRILENPIVCKDSDYFSVWLYLLLEATHSDYVKLFKGEKIVLKPGQLITGRKVISEKFRVSESKVHRILLSLESEHQIERQTSNKNTLITIVNWDKYQKIEQLNATQLNDNCTTIEQQLNTLQEQKNKRTKENNKKDIVAFPTEKTTKPKFTIDSFEMLCVETLIHSCLELYPNSKVPASQVEKDKWALDIDRMKRLDNRTEEDIRQALEFAINNPFWKQNIRSAKKFREKFETLLIQSKQNKSVSIGYASKKQTHGDFNEMMKGWLENE